ncbi:MAG: hypothetical protein M3376_11020 [Actinomycetota bacterium]|nr:hypothetical protein [Actinomycetota bacterium]
MRTLMKVQMDTEAGSKAIADGSLNEVMQSTMERLKPEAAYFGPEDGVRTAFIIFDLEHPSQLPSITEPLFRTMKAKVTFMPVMNREDLLKGLQEIQPA